MAGFSASEAALEGFRITRENPRAFATWAGASFLVSILTIAVDAIMPASVRHGVEALNAQQTLAPSQFVDAMLLAAPVLIFFLATLSVTAAAVYRLILRHEDARFGYLRLGADELRLMALAVIGFLVTVGLVVAVSMVVGLLVAILSFVVPSGPESLEKPAVALTLAIVFGILVRLSLAPIATFAERRITLFESWTLTRGHFWPLLGAYTLALACIVVIGVLILVVFTGIAGAVVLAAGGKLSDLSAIFSPDRSSLRAYFSVGLIAYMIVSSIFSALWYAVIAAPGAVVYQHLHGAPPSPVTAPAEAG